MSMLGGCHVECCHREVKEQVVGDSAEGLAIVPLGKGGTDRCRARAQSSSVI